jgi:translation initiation factor 5B
MELEKQNITPICCILGHVDVGKTKLLDHLRHTSTQEVSGITQQIGTTFFNKNTLNKLCGNLAKNLSLPGMIMIDTPGHECFSTMRYVGAIISNVIVVAVDINKGLEKETIDCLKFVNEHCDMNFVIALNKLDKIDGWKQIPNAPLRKALNKNKSSRVSSDMKTKVNRIICQLAELEINACLYYENKNVKEFISMVPISANSGEGVSDLILLISKMMEIEANKIMESEYSRHTFGYVIDNRYEDHFGNFNISVNINNTITVGDEVIIIDRDTREISRTSIKQIVSTTEGKEMKDKTKYKNINNVIGTQGIGLFFKDTIKVNPGSLYFTLNDKNDDEIHNTTKLFRKMLRQKSNQLMCTYDKKDLGVHLNSPSINMISGLIKTTNLENIHVHDHHVGRITKELIIKVSGTYIRAGKDVHKNEYLKRYAVILSFDPVMSHGDETSMLNSLDKQITSMCKDLGVTIIIAKTVYKLVQQYDDYVKKLDSEFFDKYRNIKTESVTMRILPQYVFLKTTPLMFGITIVIGELDIGTILVATKGEDKVILGKVTSMQKDKVSVTHGNKKDELCIRIEQEEKVTYGCDFDDSYIISNYMTNEETMISNFIVSLK